jgi:Peptidase propeptide and YPEB domain
MPVTSTGLAVKRAVAESQMRLPCHGRNRDAEPDPFRPGLRRCVCARGRGGPGCAADLGDAFGEVSWEVNEEGKPIFEGSWRAGEPDGEGHIAGPGLLMPGTFTIGSRYLFDDHQSIALGGSENVQSGIEITVPSGTFKDCVRLREQGLQRLKDITGKIWCPGVGLAYDTSDGNLIASNALPASNPASDVSSIGTFRNRPLSYNPPVAKVSGAQATKIALGAFEGTPTKLSIERKKGKNVYVVEVTTKDKEEKDVFVDIESGQVVGVD